MGTEKNIQKNNGTGVRVQAQPSGIKTELSRLARNIESKWIGRLNRWPEIAREPIRLEIINTCCYAFGTKIACLRLLVRFALIPQWHGIEPTGNGKEWYFFVEPTIKQTDINA